MEVEEEWTEAKRSACTTECDANREIKYETENTKFQPDNARGPVID